VVVDIDDVDDAARFLIKTLLGNRCCRLNGFPRNPSERNKKMKLVVIVFRAGRKESESE